MPCSSRSVRKNALSSALSRLFSPAAGSSRQSRHRIGTHRACDFESPLRAVGQRAGRIVGALGEAHAIEPVTRLVDGARFGTRVGARADQAEHSKAGGDHQGVVLRDEQIFEQRHPGKQPHVLKRACDTRLLGDAKLRQALEQKRGAVRMSKHQPADRRLVEAGDAVE